MTELELTAKDMETLHSGGTIIKVQSVGPDIVINPPRYKVDVILTMDVPNYEDDTLDDLHSKIVSALNRYDFNNYNLRIEKKTV